MIKPIIHLTAALLLTLFSTLSAQAVQPEAAPVSNNSTDPAKADLSVLEHFRTFTGPRTPDALLRLFSTPAAAAKVKQKPQAALSDGQTNVELTLQLDTTDKTAPNFACIEARLISAKQAGAGVWQLVLLPDAGSWKSAVIILQGDSSQTVPLTVAPPLSGDLSMKGFAAYLKESQADEKQRIDLNGDGNFDYQDDFVLAVNVLSARDASPHDLATRNKRALEMTPLRPKR
jgi:hypothetical protein